MNERIKYPISVLIVDDEPAIVEQLEQIVGRRVETVHTAANGQEALEIYKRLPVDMIISDVDMPVLNGIELLKVVRENDGNFPFILSTGLKNLDILIEAIEHGITAFLPKPIQIKNLLARIEAVARTKQLESEVKQSAALLEQYKGIVDASSIISKTDPRGIITYANEMFCRVSGYERDELIGKPHSIVRDPAMPSKVFAQMWETIKAKEIWHGIVHNRTKEGIRYTVKSTIAPITDANGAIIEYIALREDITDLMQKDEQIRSERQKLDTILNHVDSVVGMVSFSEKLMFANRKFFDIFPFTDMFDFKRSHSCICDIFVKREGFLQQMMGELYWVEHVMAYPDEQHHALMIDKEGRERIFTVNVQKIAIDGKELFVVTLGDVTELQRAKEEAKTAAKMKGEFLANMSHEIRTPMNGILGFASLLAQSELGDKQKRYVDIINSSTHTLLGIVNDILDFSKLESGKFELDFIPINPIVEFEKIAQLFVAKMEEKKITFDIDIDPLISECIHIDLLRTQQVVSNLLGNAVKFTPENGQIVFYARRLGDTQEGELIRIGVKDSGIGITPEQQSKIFEAFSQADSSTTRKFGGTGLGLSISSHLVSLMGGELKVQSAEGEGSDFYFEISVRMCPAAHPLSSFFTAKQISIIPSDHPNCMELICTYLQKLQIPYRVCDARTPIKTDDIVILFCDADSARARWLEEHNVTTIVVCSHSTELRGGNMTLITDLEHNISALYNVLLDIAKDQVIEGAEKLSQSRIRYIGNVLIAEDNSVNQMLMQEYLSRYDLFPDIVENGQAALDKISQGRYDLIFMDMNMPIMSGIEALKLLQSKGNTVPVVALTANAMEGDRERFLEQGFDGYVSKPIVLEDLEAVLSRYLHREKKENVHDTYNEVEHVQNVGEALFDMELMRRELPVPEAVIHKILRAFIDSIDNALSDLKVAVETGNREKIYQSSHYIKGAVGNLRIKPVEELAGKIETLSRTASEADYPELYRQLEEQMAMLKWEIGAVLETV